MTPSGTMIPARPAGVRCSAIFLKSGNSRRVLFLVDRLELEDQAKKAFTALLANDYKTVIFKENRDDWRHAEIVVSTVQSFLFNNKYQHIFSPTDFDLVISDEAHRSIGGNSRAVFEYFIGYKLGLTATPRDYLRRFDKASPTKDPREHERRLLLDTYRTFGCEDIRQWVTVTGPFRRVCENRRERNEKCPAAPTRIR
jgi:type I restriction enzyme R subunit